MKDEIKEILLKISESINNHETIYLNEFERKNLLIYIHKLEMKETDENLKTKIAELEQENEDLKITKAGHHATIEILKEENESLKGIAELRKDTLIMSQKKVDKLQERIDKAIEYIKEIGKLNDAGNYQQFKDYKEYNELLNILQGDDK